MEKKKYRKKPIVIEAIQYDGTRIMAQWLCDNNPKIYFDCGEEVKKNLDSTDYFTGALVIETLEGEHIASPGDFIITGIAGEQYPCKPDIFNATYDEVE